MNTTFILQGSFPGGIPYSSVIKRVVKETDDSPHYLLQRKIIFNSQRDNGNRLIEIDPHRLNLKTPGRPLPGEVLQRMQSVFDTNFSDVKIHLNDGQAESIGAFAFTTGNDIYFAHDQYNPNSPYGQRLLAHELTHVVQQRSGKVKNNLVSEITFVNNPGFEAEAERISLKTIQAYACNVIQLTREVGKLKSPIGHVTCKATDGENTYIGESGSGLKPPKSVITEIKKLGPSKEQWDDRLNCAEVAALDKALNANSNSLFRKYKGSSGKIDDKKGFINVLQNSNEPLLKKLVFSSKRDGEDYPPCRNCAEWLEPIEGTGPGTRSPSNKYKIIETFIKPFCVPDLI